MATHFFEIIEIVRPQIVSLISKRIRLAAYMDNLALGYLPGSGTFYFFVSIEGYPLGSERFCEILLKDHHIAAVPGIGYGKSCDDFIRISIGVESETAIQDALVIIKGMTVDE